MIATVLILLAIYLACGFLFAVPFLLIGVKRIDPHAAHGRWGFRVLIFPGTILLWPLLAKRWLSGATEPPEQNDPHRRTARTAGLRPAATQSVAESQSSRTTYGVPDVLRLTEPRSEP